MSVPAGPRRPPARILILSRAMHPSFSPELAKRLVGHLSRRELVQLWNESTKLIDQPIPAELLLNVVVLRDLVLRRLEIVHPRLLEACLRLGRPSRFLSLGAGRAGARRRPRPRTGGVSRRDE